MDLTGCSNGCSVCVNDDVAIDRSGGPLSSQSHTVVNAAWSESFVMWSSGTDVCVPVGFLHDYVHKSKSDKRVVSTGVRTSLIRAPIP
eukprot:scaffold38423_cov51-Attheya_sp.AAC.9